MNTTILLFLILTPCASLGAQSVSLTADWVGTAQLVAAVGATTDIQSIGPGPITGQSFVRASVGVPADEARVEVSWAVMPPLSDDVFTFDYAIEASTWSANPASAVVNGHEVLLMLQAPTQRDVFLFGSLDLLITTGVTAPFFEVDIGDDGVVEMAIGNVGPASALTIGPQPLPVRIRCSGSVATTGFPESLFRVDCQLRVVPDNSLEVTELYPGCGEQLQVVPAFSHDGVRLVAGNSAPPIYLAVLSTNLQPILLPVSVPVPTCILMPAPDAVLVLPPAPGGIDLPIPAGVRPFVFFAQAVGLPLPGLLTASEGYVVDAY